MCGYYLLRLKAYPQLVCCAAGCYGSPPFYSVSVTPDFFRCYGPPLLIYRHQQRMTELCINLPSGGFLSLRVFPPFKLVLLGSGYRPRSWLLRRRLVPSCGDRVFRVFSCSPLLNIIMTEPDPIKVLMRNAAAGFQHHVSDACAPPGLLRGAGISVYSYIKHDE